MKLSLLHGESLDQVFVRGIRAMSIDDAKNEVIDFVRGSSLEISTHDEDLIPILGTRLSAGTTIYIAHSPKTALDDVIRVATRIQGMGFRASPHIVARRLESERSLKAALGELRDCGIEQIMLVAGDCERSAGKFSNTLEVLDTGRVTEAGITHVGVCGHPEGHKAVGRAALWDALHFKQSFAARTGVKVHIVSQFGFDPDAVCAWAQRLVQQGICLPVHVGIAGPTSLPKLIRFAMRCGVGNSLHALLKNMSAMSNVVRLPTSPDEMITALVRRRSKYRLTQLAQPHFYSFGGAVATARWLSSVVSGKFEMPADDGKFSMTA
jgi:methylenetetrahydrofolate reductase (NADPH)